MSGIRRIRRVPLSPALLSCFIAAVSMAGSFHVAAAETTGTVPQDTVFAEEDTASCICMKLEGGGTVRIELYPEQAPKTVERILKLVREGFYDGLKFHRVESFLVQTGRKDSELEPLEGEMFGQKIWHEEGMVGMARLPTGYDTATTQFYIMKERKPKLNGEYTLFGCVVEGMEHIRDIKKGNKIDSISLCGAE
jgi:cyclophilin family peptidyl-prolyl cis-trans isomerase